MAPAASTDLGAALVVGGAGFLGYHLVRQLLEDAEFGPVYSLDRLAGRNQQPGAHYYCGSITDPATIDKVLRETRPAVVFHAASPNATYPDMGRGDFYETNVKGTKKLLTLCSESGAVSALVFTSSVDVYADPPHDDVDESHQLWPSGSACGEYTRTKAIADRIVLAADGPRLRTVSLRDAHTYGERCTQEMRAVVDMSMSTSRMFRFGAGQNNTEMLSVNNAATAHVLAAKALLDPSRARGKVAGEAFNISDGFRTPFWQHVADILSAAWGRPAADRPIVLPAWIAVLLFAIIEWLYWILTFGRIEPPEMFGRTSLNYQLYDMTYKTDKARDRLGFRPVNDHDGIIKRAVAHELRNREVLAVAKSK